MGLWIWDKGGGVEKDAMKEGIHEMFSRDCQPFRATTVLAVRKNSRSVMAGDGQVSFGDTIMKQKANKVRYMFKDKVIRHSKVKISG